MKLWRFLLIGCMLVSLGLTASMPPGARAQNLTAKAAAITRTFVYHQLPLTGLDGADRGSNNLAMSADGHWVAFTSNTSTNNIYSINTDGSDLRLADTTSTGGVNGLYISADGSKILWGNADKWYTSLRLARADGSEAHAVINIDGGYKDYRLSADGTKVFFIVDRSWTRQPSGESETDGGLYVVNADGSGLRQIVSPQEVATLLGTTVNGDAPFYSCGSGPQFGVSDDATRLVFELRLASGCAILRVNSDGSDLQAYNVFPANYYVWVNNLGISGNGSTVFYDVSPAPCCSIPSEAGVFNFDGSGKRVLLTTGFDGESNYGVQLSYDGSKLSTSNYGRLYNTDGSGVLQLSVAGGGWSSDPESIIDSFYMHMNGDATRFVYFDWCGGCGKLALGFLEINPASLGAAPTISDMAIAPPYVTGSGWPAAITTARVASAPGATYQRVSNAFMKDGQQTDIGGQVLQDNGAGQDVTASDGIFTSDNLWVWSAVRGALAVRVRAEVRAADGLRHASVVEFTPFSIVDTLPTTYTISGHVTDNNPQSLAGVTISAGAGGSATTNGTGDYSITGVPAGTYTLTPSKSGYTFSPPSLTVTVPPTASDQNFTGTPVSSAQAWFSDSFNRANADRCILGQADLALGGSGVHYYLPIYPVNGTDPTNPVGANIVSNVLQNNGLDYGGVQFTASPGTCSNTGIRGENIGQDMNIRADLLVPTDASNHVTQAGPYFRSRAAARGDGIIGGTSAGYWVQLDSTGQVKVKMLNPQSVVASAAAPASFDNTVFHTLETAVQGTTLQVALDGQLLTFNQGGSPVTTVAITATSGSNDGTAGISFGAEPNRGLIGGQRADNLVVSAYHALAQAPTTYTVSGHVADNNAQSLAGVTVSAGAGGSAATNASGDYSIANVPAGDYTLTPAKSGYTFSPLSRTVSVPFNTSDQNFTGTPVSTDVWFSDSFNRADADRCALGQADLALGGSGVHYYLPIYPANGTDPTNPVGANIVSNGLQNNGLDYGGVQFTASPGACSNTGIRGENIGQDMNIRADLLVPTDASNHVTQAGPYFRSRAAARGDGIIGGSSAGYWVQLDSTGQVTVKRLNPQSVVAFTKASTSFDNTVFHTLETALQGTTLQVALDGQLLSFNQGGSPVTSVTIAATSGSNDGAAGISFGAEPNRGLIGGQRADNLVVSAYHALSGSASTYTISGRVTDDSAQALADVTVSAGAGGSAATNASGYYTLANVPAGAYTLNALLAGYTFSPLLVKVPPEATGKNFTGYLLPPPTGLEAHAGVVSISLEWSPAANPAVTGYNVYRSQSIGGPFTKVTITPVSGDTWTDSDAALVKGATYYYYLKSVAGIAESAPSNTASAKLGTVTLSIPNVKGPHGQPVTVPVNIENASGLSICAMDVFVSYTPATLVISEVQRTILTLQYDFAVNIVEPGIARISLAAAECGTPLFGPGTLFNLIFTVPGAAGAASPLTFDVLKTDLYVNADLVNPVPLTLVNGAFTVQAAYVRGDLNGDGVVTPADAAIALQLAVEKKPPYPPTPEQAVAGDVNGDGRINSADAALIMRMAAGLLQMPSAGAGFASMHSLAPTTLTIPNQDAEPGQPLALPVQISNATGVAGAELVVNFEPSVLSVTGVQTTALTGNFNVQWNVPTAGELRISLSPKAGYEAGLSSGSGDFVTINLAVSSAAPLGSQSPVTLAMVRLSDTYSRNFETSALQTDVSAQNGVMNIYTVPPLWKIFLPLVKR